MHRVSVNLMMFEGKTRECISRAVQQRMFDWGYKWSNVSTEYRFTKEGYLYMSISGTITYSCNEIPHSMRSCPHIEYTAEEFLSLTADPLKVLEVGKPYQHKESGSVVIFLRQEGEQLFTGVKIYDQCNNSDDLWTEKVYMKQHFIPIDPSRIQIEVLPCK